MLFFVGLLAAFLVLNIVSFLFHNSEIGKNFDTSSKLISISQRLEKPFVVRINGVVINQKSFGERLRMERKIRVHWQERGKDYELLVDGPTAAEYLTEITLLPSGVVQGNHNGGVRRLN